MDEPMSKEQEIARNAARIATRAVGIRARGRRLMIAIAGAPGSGKSRLAEAVAGQIGVFGRVAEVMPMDGFHLDNRLLEPRGLLPRKGAPETFDFHGFAVALKRVRDEPAVIIPVFDRDREIAIAGAREIGPQTEIVVVEGNYLLLDEDPWRQLSALWDLAVFLEVPEDELERRLFRRWNRFGYSAEVAQQKALGNDIPNARRVVRHAGRADMVVTQAPGTA